MATLDVQGVMMLRCFLFMGALVQLPALTLLSGVPLAAQDTVLVRADNPPVWGEAPTLVEELRIGTLGGDERYVLGRVQDVAVGADGTIWVADTQLGSIRRYAPDGRHIDDVGRRGEGPGEFSAHIQALRALPDGGMAAWDPGLARISIFEADGRLRSTVPLPAAGILGGLPKPLEVDTLGRMYALTASASGTPPNVAFDPFWIRTDADGAVLDSVRLVRTRVEGTVHPIEERSTLSPDGHLVRGRTDVYAFYLLLPGGPVRQIERASSPVAYQPAERRETQVLEDHFAERNARPARTIPTHKPVWSSFDVDQDGRLWIECYSDGVFVAETDAERERREAYDNPPREWRQAIVYDVIEPSGRYLGSLRFPGLASRVPTSQIQVAVARGDLVWAVTRGEYDESYVVRYRITPGS